MGEAVGRGGHYGACRLLCAVPAILVSTVLVSIVVGGLGWWALPAVAGWLLAVVAGWLLAGWLLLLGPAERVAVRVAYRFRPPTGSDAAWLAWLRERVQDRCATARCRFDWYLRVES